METDLPLSIIELVKQVEALEDYEVAADALLALSRRDPATCARLALRILAAGLGDVYLRASAFAMLYGCVRDVAFDYIHRHARDCEPYVFAAMLDQVVDDVGILQESVALQRAVRYLKPIVALRAHEDAPGLARIVADFYRYYGDQDAAAG